MKPFWKIFLVIFVLAGGGFYWWTKQSGAKPGEAAPTAKSEGKADGKAPGKRGGGPINVTAVKAVRAPMPVVIDAVGTVESEHSVAVRPQVNGVLDAVLFREGDRVKQGQALFRLDARPMQAAVDQARAALARDQAQYLQAQAQEARLRPLMEKDYVTRQEYDVAATQAKALESTVNANKAALEQAQLQMSYAHITAPISGRTGSLSVRSGNLVTGGTGGAPLVVINSTQPILVALSVPQRYLDDVRKYWGTPDLKVEISANPGTPAVASGQLVFIDNSVNPTTGTITLKAQVKNEKEELWPGQFIAARIILRVEKDAVVLPEAAVLPGQSGTFVYLVRDGRAKVQAVTVDRQVGERMVISSGLTGDEEVLINVPPSVTDGSQVVVRAPGSEKSGEAGEGKSGKSGKGEKGAKGNKEEGGGKDNGGGNEGNKGGDEKSGKAKNSPVKGDASKEAK
jgi:multidrug efflux system membrane fusion protein